MTIARSEHRVARVGMSISTAVVLLSCVTAHREMQPVDPMLDISSIEEIVVTTSGVSTETDLMTLHFEGQVVLHTGHGQVLPVAQVRVYRQDPRRGDAYPVEMGVDEEGRFSKEVTFLVCRVAEKEWPHWPTFIFAAAGCEDKQVEFNADWRPSQIVMSCPGRE